jgi:hypothetical protein
MAETDSQRHDLAGQPVAEVDPAHRAEAAARLATIRPPRQRR